MKDMVPKGTGNSRTLKSVSNFLTLYPTYNDFVAAIVAGTLPIDLGAINSAGCDEVGTPLNKANLLTDATATAIGLTGSNPTVNDALAAIGSGKATLDSHGKVTPDQLSSRIVNVTLAANESLTLDNSYKNATICVTLSSSSGTSNIIVPDEFDVEDEFEVFIRQTDSSATSVLTIKRPSSGSGSIFNGDSSVSLSTNLGLAVFKCFGKDRGFDGDPYEFLLRWLVKGDI